MSSVLKRIPIQILVGITVFLMVLGLLSGLGWMGSGFIESTFQNEVEREQQAYLALYADQIDSKLTLAQNVLESIAPHLSASLFSDADAAQSFLEAQIALKTIFDNGLYLVSNDGQIIAESPLPTSGRNRNIAYREYFQVPTRTHRPYISKPYASKHAADRPAVVIAIPIFNSQGDMIGRLHGGFDLLGHNFLAELPDTVIGKKGYLYLVDENRTMILHPDRSRILGTAAVPGINHMLDKGLQGFEGSGQTITSYGVRQLASTRWLKSVRWMLVSNYPMEELLQPFRHVLNKLLLAGVTGMFISLCLLLLILNRVTRPLSKLVRHIEKIQGDDFPPFQPDAFSSLEIWKLTQSFGDLFRKLSKRQSRLRDSEELFRAIFRHSPFSIVITRFSDGVYVEVNPAFEKTTGYRAEDVIGKTASQFVPQEYTTNYLEFETVLAHTGQIDSQELALSNKNGKIAHVIFSAAVFLKHNEKYVISTGVDISERKQAERKLIQQREELLVLNQLARTVTTTLSIESVCRSAVDRISEVLALDVVILFIRKDAELHPVASGPHPPILLVQNLEIHHLGKCLCGEAAEKKEAIFSRNIDTDTRTANRECRDSGIHSFAAIPLIFDDQVLGVLGTGSLQERDLQQSAGFLETAADQLAIAIHNANIFEETCNYAGQLQQYIAERELTQKNLLENERRLSLAMSATADAIWEWNLMTEETYFSPRWYEMLGYTNHKFPMTLETWRNICHPDDFDTAIECIRSSIRNLSRFTTEFRMRAENGSWLWIMGRGKVAETDANGTPKLLIGTNTDITQRKKAEIALQASESMLKSVFQAVPLGISVTRDNRIIETINEGMFAMFGYSPEEMIGQNSRFLYFTDEEYQTVGHQLYNSDKDYEGSIEVRMRRKNGSAIQALLSASLLEPANPESGAAVAVLDISHRKHLETQLRQAQKAEAIGQLAGGIAHDFNNILGGILGFCELALVQVPDNPARAEISLQRVLQAGNRAKDLVGQILRFSRQDDPVFGYHNLANIVREVLNLMQAALPANIEVRSNISDKLPKLRADASQLHQMVMNLCTNAFHAMRGTSGVLSVSLDCIVVSSPIYCRNRDLPAGEYVRLKVADSGHGMPQNILDRIFDPYFTTKEKGEGTGLGLSVTIGIVDSHSGGIQVESTENIGTTFIVYLPSSNGPLEASILTPSEIPTGNERILFVDDESLFIEMGRDILSGLGYQVTCIQSSTEALDRFSQIPDQYDLVITDQTMPKMTGLELIEKLKSLRPEIPVIICTGFSENIQAGDPLISNISKILFKPYSMIDIAMAIREVLNG